MATAAIATKNSSIPPVSPNKAKRVKNWLLHPRKWIRNRSPTAASDPFPAAKHREPLDVQAELDELAEVVSEHMPTDELEVLHLSEVRCAGGWIYVSPSNRMCQVHGIVDGPAKPLQKKKLYSLKRLPSVAAPSKPNPTYVRDKKTKNWKKLIREAALLARLGSHPNIVSLKGLPANLSSYDDFFVLVDRLQSDTLEVRIRQWRKERSNPTSWDALLYLTEENDDDTVETPSDDYIPRKTNYAFQIAKALQACHHAGIIVRDLSPKNIGFHASDPHRIQLLDLTNALDTSRPGYKSSDKTPLVGHRRYMATELWRTGVYTPKADVYSWAMVYYEMCMERKPFQGYTETEHQKYVVERGERPLLASYYLPEGIDAILEKAWAHDPKERVSIDKVCYKMQGILIDLDSSIFYEPADGEFLFDVYIDNIETDLISELEDGDFEDMSLNPSDIPQAEPVIDVDELQQASDATLVIPQGAVTLLPAEVEATVPLPKLPSRSSSVNTYASQQDDAQPRKLVSSAA